MSASMDRLVAGFEGGIAISGGAVEVVRTEVLRGPAMDTLVHAAVFADDAARASSISMLSRR